MASIFGGGSSPQPPPIPPPPAPPTRDAAADSAAAEAARIKRGQGRASTILTSGQGDTNEVTLDKPQAKTLLGS